MSPSEKRFGLKNMRLSVGIVAFASGVAFVAPAVAQMCSAPLKPLCVDQGTTYEDEARTLRCRSDIDRYEADMEAYVKCLEQAVAESEGLAEKTRAEFDARATKRE